MHSDPGASDYSGGERAIKRMLAVVACFLAGAICHLNGQTLEVTPKRVMVDESATIRATGLQPGERVAIRGELVDGAGESWNSQAEFVADAQGLVDTSRQAPVAGSYKELSAMGLVWSMMPISRKVARYRAPQNLGAQTVEFRLVAKSGKTVTASLEQMALGEGVTRVIVRDAVLRGTLFLPAGIERRPGVLVLGGSEGGLPARRAAWLASHGYSALALAYFRYEDLPERLVAIPLEYFGRALAWMAEQPRISGKRLGVIGVSRGGELALQLGSMFERVGAVVAYAPANLRNSACCGFTSVPYAWTWNGRPLAFRPNRGADVRVSMLAEIAVEKTEGPILLISGQDDGVWPSSSMAGAIVARLKSNKFPFEVEHLRYPHAGHAAGRPEIVPSWQGTATNPASGREVEMGGTQQGNADSSVDAIPKVLEFLRQALRPGGSKE